MKKLAERNGCTDKALPLSDDDDGGGKLNTWHSQAKFDSQFLSEYLRAMSVIDIDT